MKKLLRHPLPHLLCALTFGLQACGGSPLPEGEAPRLSTPAATSQALQDGALDADTDILAALQSIPGLTVVREGPSRFPGTRFFVLTYEQPVDHAQPAGRHFLQRMTLLHRSVGAPMVLAATGYGIVTTAGLTEPTALLQANQLLVEHRFFGPSTPQPATWEHLTLEQAAADHHRVVQAFKALYGARWVTTGASKGGMTSLYHRALYPEDVDATVAYVAPNSYGPEDPRYIQFLSRVGEAACRERIQAFQRDLLSRREELVPLLAEAAEAQGATFGFLGADKVFEFSVLELPFSFWQYGQASFCPFIPEPGAPASVVLDALDGIVGFFAFSDVSINYYAPYYFQAGTQLGNYRSDERHLQGLLRYPGQYVGSSLVPFSLEPYGFDHQAMHSIETWVKNRGERILLVYGENDPWSTGAFEVREGNGSYRYFQPGGNHGSIISRLPEPERTEALQHLRTWAGVAAPQAMLQAGAASLSGEDFLPLIVDRRRPPPAE